MVWWSLYAINVDREKAHINLDLITFNSNEYQSEQFKDYYDTLRKVIINYIDITENYIRLNSIKERLYSFNEVLNNGSILCDKLYKALTSFNYDEYCVAYDEYDVLLRKKEIFNAKEDILKRFILLLKIGQIVLKLEIIYILQKILTLI